MDIEIHKVNESWMWIGCDDGISAELHEFFTFEVPGARFSPKVKARQWDGKIRLFSLSTRQLLFGLLSYVLEFAKDAGYTISMSSDCYPPFINLDELNAFLDDLHPLNEKGEHISFRDYQRDAVHEVLKWSRRTIVSPTSSGKSLIMYGICRWLLMHGLEGKILIVVPTKSLVLQMIGDFDAYSAEDEDFYAGDEMHGIMGGVAKDEANARIYVSTWQSIFKEDKKYFSQFAAVFGDECHQYKSAEIKKVAEKSINAAYRAGFTGTLLAKEGAKCHKLMIEGVFGRAVKPKVASGKEVSTKLLMDRGEVALLNIEIISMMYSQEVSESLCAVKDYDKEVDFVASDDRRSIFICKEAAQEEGNTLVLFTRKKHGKLMKDWMDQVNVKLGTKKSIYLLDGDNEVEEREELRAILEANNDVVAFCSYGIFSQGISVKNIHHVYFGSPYKSIIKVLQSIGRGLRISATKQNVRLKDFVDTFARPRTNGRARAANFLMKHAAERVKIYSKEQFQFKMRSIDLGK